MADRKRPHEFQAGPGRNNKSRPVLHDRPHVGKGGKQPHAGRHSERTGRGNPEVRKGIGGVIFALGVPTAIAGIVMTVVDATDNENEKKYPSAFSYVGPIVLAVAVIFFVVGIMLSTSLISDGIHRCFSFDDPNSFCRVHFPRLSQCIDPDDTITRNRAALNALQTEPGKSALKRVPLPPNDALLIDSGLTTLLNKDSAETRSLQQPAGYQTPVSLTNIDVVSEHSKSEANRGGTKGVRFSGSDDSETGPGNASRAQLPSTASDNSSALSVRHCKVYPKENNIWHTEEKVLLPPPAPPNSETTEL